jgi:sensor histidine kinase regulating citrate/malate metabolism
MTKTASKTQANNNQLVLLTLAALLVGLAILSFKYLALKKSWHSYGVQTLRSTDRQRDLNSAEDAMVLATTIGQFPEGSPLYRQTSQLEKFVAAVSKQTGRSFVVVDQKGIIIANTIPAEVGKKFVEDKDGEVMKTIADGQTRSFIEESTAYPQGIHQVVVPLKNAAGATVGAVVLSASSVFE